MTFEEMAKALGKAYLTFPNLNLTRPTVAAWHDLFREFPFEAFAAALDAAVTNAGQKFFPAPGEVTSMLLAKIRAKRPTGLEVWEFIQRIADRNDAIKRLSDLFPEYAEILSRSLLAVDWRLLRYGDLEKDIPWLKRDFVRMFDQLMVGAVELLQITEAERKVVNLAKKTALGLPQ